MPLLEETLGRIRPVDREVMAMARHHQNNLAKPLNGLGRLEEVAVRLAGIAGDPFFQVRGKVVIVAAGDHGIVEEGVTLYPQEATAQRVANVLGGGAAINVLARLIGARVVAVDVGVAGDLGCLPNLVVRKLRRGTANMAQGPAMTFDEARGAVEAGIALVQEEIDRGADLIGTGEIGVGGHAAAAAVLSAFTGRPVAEIVGLEEGEGAGTAEREVRTVQRALDLHQPDPANPLTILAQVGGLEMGLLTGVILGSAARRRPVALDGFVSGAAALIAAGLSSRAGEYLFASHRSAEPGHGLLLSHLGLAPLLDLGLGLGEGAGAALGLGVMEAAALCQKEMATFSQAGLSGPAE